MTECPKMINAVMNKFYEIGMFIVVVKEQKNPRLVTDSLLIVT